jgi:hypothetical protein
MGKAKKKIRRNDEASPFLRGGEFKREADEANNRQSPAPSLSNVDWADLLPKEREKKQQE